MPQQIKQDLNRSGWETTDMPSVCERCLPENPFVQMLKEDYGAECKVCTRPFTIFRWKADRTSRQKRTIICLTCARLKNCCQCCMLDLNFGLPTTIRDAALKMIAPGPESSINREYYAQNNEKEIEEGRGGLEQYEKSDEKAMNLLKRLADSEYYAAKRRRGNETVEGQDMKTLPPPTNLQQGVQIVSRSDAPSTRTSSANPRGAKKGHRSTRPVFPSTAQLPPTEKDWLPPQDQGIQSLFVVGIEDDLPEYQIREFFQKYGKLQSVVCSHRAHCAFINYMTRKDAEHAADACRGRAIIAGCPLRISWGKPKQLDTTDHDTRMANARAGKSAVETSDTDSAVKLSEGSGANVVIGSGDVDNFDAIAPPGEADVQYASLTGN